MSLSHLSEGALASICSFLDGSFVIALSSTGNRLLSSKLSAAAHHLCFSTLPFAPFPYSAFNIPLLRSLEVKMVAEGISAPLILKANGRSRLLLPETPMNHLESLSFRFDQSVSLLRQEGEISRAFPNLRRLLLTTESPTSEWNNFGGCLVALPQLVEFELKVKILTVPYASIDLPYSELNGLPETLEVLKLVVPIYDYAYPQVVWPQGLRVFSLETHSLSTDLIANLPTSLESLTLQITLDGCGKGVALLPMRRLENLIFCSLNLDEWSDERVDIVSYAVDALPPNLQTWQTYIWISEADMRTGLVHCPQFDPRNIGHILALPTTLTSQSELFTLMDMLRSPYREYFPPNLKEFAISQPRQTVPNGGWKSWAPTLPQSLQTLSLSPEMNIDLDLSMIPPTVTRIDGLQLDNLDPFKLPKNLKKLSFCGSLSSQMSISSFPTSLVTLEISWHENDDRYQLMNALKPLAKLEKFRLKISNLHPMCSPPEAPWLPSSLLHLTMTLPSSPTDWDRWILSIRHCTGLKSLQISTFQSSFSMTGFRYLPPNLVSLSITCDQFVNSEIRPLSLLPQTLAVLQLHSTKPYATLGLVDEDFVALPLSLYILQLPHLPKITSNVLNMLRQGVYFKNFYVGLIYSGDAYKAYRAKSAERTN
jgi:hypothetical protein